MKRIVILKKIKSIIIVETINYEKDKTTLSSWLE